MEIEEFCIQHRNEDVHTEYVAHLALQLFDALHSVLSLPLRDRGLLHAAARLHDVGYASAPQRHMERGLELVRDAAWRGFTASQIKYILAIMSLHQQGGPAATQAPALRSLRYPLRAARLGAILRIADGLDQSHIQDAHIRDISVQSHAIVVRVSAPVSPQNIVAANRRATLWHEVFRTRISFVPDSGKRSNRIPGLKKKDHPLEYFRRHAYRSLKVIRENETGVRGGEDREALHDVRVHLRRLRTLLRLFRQPLQGTQAVLLDQRLGEISAALGPPRDFDVWLDHLDRLLKESKAPDDALVAYAERERLNAPQHRAMARAVLQDPAYAGVMRDCTYFLRVDVPESVRRQSAIGSVDRYGVDCVQRQMRKLQRTLRRMRDVTGEEGHEIRKQVRRARYVAECFAPVLGHSVREWGRLLKKTADAFGDMRDAELGLERVVVDKEAPALLAAALRAERERSLAHVKRSLRRLKKTL